MSKSIIRSSSFKVILFLYLGVVVVFYPISRMYVDEYAVRPIKFEFAFFMVLISLVSNGGPILVLFERGLKYKKILCISIVFASFMNALLLFITNGNPLSFVSNENWNSVRYICFYIVITVGILLSIFVGRFQNEAR